MSATLPDEARRRIERYVARLLHDLDLPDHLAAEVRADFIAHIEAETSAQREQGLPSDKAVDLALRRFGEAREIRRQLRTWAASSGTAAADPGSGRRRSLLAGLVIRIEDLLQDVRFAARSIVREPGFTATIVLTIAIGIAATTTIFSVVDGILLRSLPYPDPDRIVAVWPTFWYSNANFEAFERDLLGQPSSSFVAVAGYSPRSARYRDDADGTKFVAGLRVTADFFEVLGPSMTLGRTFGPGANELGNEKVVVVTHGFWQRELGADAEIVGRTITLEGAPHVVIGVLAPGYDLFNPDADLVLPKAFDRDHARFRTAEMKAIGRLKPGATVAQAKAELDAVLPGWREEFGLADDFGVRFTAVPFHEHVVGNVRPTLLLLFGSVGLILLIASANVVNLLLTRGVARQREISVRLALGARPFRVVRQLLTESTVLAIIGGAIGLIGSVFAVSGVVSLLPGDTPRLMAIAVDGRVAGFSFMLALFTGSLVSIAPALRLLTARLRESLAAGGRGATGKHHLRHLIVMTEIGLAVMLLVGAGLLVKSFWQLRQVDPGISSAGLVTFYVGAETGSFESHDEAEVFHGLVLDRLETLPGVSGVTTISQAPYNLDGGVVGCRQFDAASPDAEDEHRCRWRSVGPSYFELAGTPLMEGRSFTLDDNEGSEPVAIIAVETARELFPEGAIGERIATSFESAVEGGTPWATVVGLVADVRFLGLAEQAPMLVYRPELQAGAIAEEFGFYGLEYLVRAKPVPVSLEDVREAVHGVDPYAVVSGYNTMNGLIADSIGERRAILILMTAFTATAMLLGIIGIYGITAHGVRSRSRELSIRMALGATHADVVRQVLSSGMKIATIGALGGLALALAVARWVESFLYEVASTDAWVAASAVFLGLAVSLLATWIPARRAAAADPAQALAAE